MKQTQSRPVFRNIALATLLVSLSSCQSIQQAAVRSVADMLSSPSGSSAFTSDDDPLLVAESLPLALKLHEILLGQDPENHQLMAATGRNFAMYAGAFVLMPTDMLEDEAWEEAEEGRMRAKRLLRRGRNYLLDALDYRHPGFLQALESGAYDEAALFLEAEDANDVYWAGLSWLGMASTDPFDIELATSLDQAALLLYRALELDESISGIHEMMIQLQVSLPASIVAQMRERSPEIAGFMDEYYAQNGVSDHPQERAVHHYEKAVELSNDSSPSPHITMATAISVKKQDLEGFRSYLDRALSIDPEEHVDDRLLIIIYQDRARWLLEHVEDFFLVTE
ncbi:MAG: TRAP transporter TatT component family protein [Spirochaetales bacterium]|nr:TRAP transporter TatT component family protein [Spirochaetales bacterium]